MMMARRVSQHRMSAPASAELGSAERVRGAAAAGPSRLRIALVHNSAGGGPKRALYHLAEGLMTRGHRIDLFAPEMANERYLPLRSLGIKQRTIAWRRPPRTWNLRPLILEQATQPVRRWLYEQRCAHAYARLAAEIDGGGYDVVWVDNCQYTETPFILGFLRTPALVYCHEPKREWYEPGRWPDVELASWMSPARRQYTALCNRIADLERRYLARLAAENIAHARRVLTNSRYSKASIARAYGLEAIVSYHGVDVRTFQPLGIRREPMVLSIGRLHPLKRHDLAIRALHQLPRERRPRLLIIAVNDAPPQRHMLERLATNLGVTLEFRFSIADEALAQCYNRARVVLYLAQAEPFGLAALEAMACGTLVIAAREGGLVESVQDGVTGWLIEPTPEACARALERVLADPALERRAGEAGVAHVHQSWTWTRAVDRLEQHLMDVAGRRGR